MGLKERKLGVMKCKLRWRVEVYEQDCEDFCFCKTSRLSSPPSQQQVNEVKSSYFESVFRREGMETKMAVRMHNVVAGTTLVNPSFCTFSAKTCIRQ